MVMLKIDILFVCGLKNKLRLFNENMVFVISDLQIDLCDDNKNDLDKFIS